MTIMFRAKESTMFRAKEQTMLKKIKAADRED
jgi:hypothetical protein